VCLDLGQSTGGFTDCLLQHGAARVVGIDVGQGQLHPQLRADARVVCIEGVNARSLSPQAFWAAHDRATQVCAIEPWHRPFDLLVADVSFISLTLVLPAVAPLLQVGCDAILLIKPQFELQPGQVGKGGIVKDPALFEQVEQRLRQCCEQLGLQVLAWLDSAIEGGDGNREFLIHASKRAEVSAPLARSAGTADPQAPAAQRAHQALA
jgi:23S rRNA (cytidine1920-2'-O)/16S rRNA (cytidine1409-2'-O)-methyltransferase